MSIPPQVIHIKRKRVEEAPVTFLQFDDGAKRSRTGSNWVYQRKEAVPSRKLASAFPPVDPYRDATPVIHISQPDTNGQKAQSADATQLAAAAATTPKTLASRPSQQRLGVPPRIERRRFHMSRAVTKPQGSQVSGASVARKARAAPAVFVERIKKRGARRALKAQTPSPHDTDGEATQKREGGDATAASDEPRALKKPGTSRARSTQPETPQRDPLPASLTKPDSEEMAKRAADMNQWVLNEIGANLHDMDVEKQQQQQRQPDRPRPRFRPRVPAQRNRERHAQSGTPASLASFSAPDVTMSDVTDDEEDEEDEDWVIEEYIRIPASYMAVDVSPTEVGVLVLDEDQDSSFFFGPEQDDDDEWAEDEEDENAENHYTADYPEDEVDSDDEFDRHAYLFRNANASDDEEFDKNDFSDGDDDEVVLEGDRNDEDAAMARIRNYIRRNEALQR